MRQDKQNGINKTCFFISQNTGLLFIDDYFIFKKMAEVKAFTPVKLICGIISSNDTYFHAAREKLIQMCGQIDSQSHLFPFDKTTYYQKEMGENLKRMFISFEKLIPPEILSPLKLKTNKLEMEISREKKAESRAVNIDPGYLTTSALIMATAKNFSHRIPLSHGIYGHLEFLFTRKGIKLLDWTYPDFKNKEYENYFIKVRNIYLSQLREISKKEEKTGA